MSYSENTRVLIFLSPTTWRWVSYLADEIAVIYLGYLMEVGRRQEF